MEINSLMTKKIIKKRRKYNLGSQFSGYGFMLPGFLFVAIFMGYPLVDSLYLSFTKYNFATDFYPTFVGLQNYINLFRDTYFLDAFSNTMIFTVIFLPAVMVISLVLALLLDAKVKGSGIFRTCIFIAVIVPLSLTGIIFQWILNNQYGLFNTILRTIHMSWAAKDWLGNGTWAMVSIIVVTIWKNVGMMVIMFLAGLQAISTEIEEASMVDGANSFQRIIHITLPNLKESYIVTGLWAILSAVKVFEQPFIMTNGGPGTATLVLYQYTWINAFKYFNMGYASSIAYFMTIIILVLAAINMFINRSDDKKEKNR
jgi:multiple sugar transport system permease protein